LERKLFGFDGWTLAGADFVAAITVLPKAKVSADLYRDRAVTLASWGFFPVTADSSA
jgi:hypothetical protein